MTPSSDDEHAAGSDVPRETDAVPPREQSVLDVSRETEPSAAASVFGERLPLARRYVDHLCSTGVDHGLIGPREVPRIWTRHVLNCAVVQELIPVGATVLDVGSGAGLPGLALLLARPDLSVTLVEPLERRSNWLTMVADELGVPVRVVRGRAEELDGVEAAEFVTARAVAPLTRLAQLGLPLLHGGGAMLAIKGRTAQDEVDASTVALRRLGATQVDVVTCGGTVLDPATTVVRVRVGAAGEPGRSGRPGKAGRTSPSSKESRSRARRSHRGGGASST